MRHFVEPGSVKIVTAIIAKDESLSNAIPVTGYSTVEIHMPAAWDAANLTFQSGIEESGTFQDMYDDNEVELTVKVAAERNITTTKLQGAAFVRFRSGTSAAPVAQAAARTITVVLKK